MFDWIPGPGTADEVGSILDDWHLVMINNYRENYDKLVKWIPNIKGQFRCLGHYWYFEDKDDAILFKLTWGE